MMVSEVTEADFQERVVERSKEVPVVVDFWAEWCGPCRQLGPAIEAAVTKREGRVDLAKVDVDSNQGLAQAFGVRGIPAVKAFRDGQVVDEFTGAIPPPAVEQFLDRVVPSPAEELADSDDEESLRGALALDPHHSGAAVKLARILVGRGETDEAGGLLEPLAGDFVADGLLARIQLASGEGADGLDPSQLDRALTAWDAGDPETALEGLQQAIGSTTDAEARDLIRRVMVAIFTELGPAHSLASAHRRRLASALS